MKLKTTTPIAGCTETYIGMNKRCRLVVTKIDPDIINGYDKLWYFAIIGRDSIVFAYNSCVDNLMFSTKEECVDTAYMKLKECEESNFSKELDNVYKK